MPRRTALAAVVALVVMAAATLGWVRARGVVDVAPAAQASSTACTAATRLYPPALGSLTRGTLAVAAAAVYGDPAVIVRCGVTAPGPTSDECIAVDDVDWVVHPLSDGVRMTTFGRDPALEVLVPSAHSPAPLLLPGLGAAARSLPPNGRTCAG